ncbi:hypothetical protein G9A89_008450 [Geosiphon pyriformis]|nr:hypothetical protein G9A89_008450 [Geosiphon pyriformis]
MNSTNKRKEAVTSEETPPTKKLSRQARARRNKKQRREQEQIVIHQEPGIDANSLTSSTEMNSIINTTDIIFDPTRMG